MSDPIADNVEIRNRYITKKENKMRVCKVLYILFIFMFIAELALSKEETETKERVPLFLYTGSPPTEDSDVKLDSVKELDTIKQEEKVEGEKADTGNLFLDANRDLKRIGIDEIRDMGSVKYKSGNYRVDSDFRLGYGDSVYINLTGKIEALHKLTIGRNGNIAIPLVGEVGLMGLSLDEARLAAKRVLDQKYSNVELDLSLADAQDIRINVLGYAERPGIYSISPFCKIAEVTSKLAVPNRKGSISDIKLIREGKEILTFNAYDYLYKADQSKNPRLCHGDTIYIPKLKNLIAIKGNITNPGLYELTGTEPLSKIIDTAEGIINIGFKTKVSILKVDLKTGSLITYKEFIFEPSKGIDPKDDVAIDNNDTIVVTTELDCNPYYEDTYRTVKLRGEVKIPGDYVLTEGETIRSLIEKAGGVKNIAFVEGAVFTRDDVKEKEKSILDELVKSEERAILKTEGRITESMLTQLEREILNKSLEQRRKALKLMASYQPQGRIVIDLKNILNGEYDILLKKGDNIYIPPSPDWVMVSGAVYGPGAIAFREGKELEGYLNTVGGCRKNADKDDIYIIKANGQAKSKITGYDKIFRGDIIVVPEKIE